LSNISLKNRKRDAFFPFKAKIIHYHLEIKASSYQNNNKQRQQTNKRLLIATNFYTFISVSQTTFPFCVTMLSKQPKGNFSKLTGKQHDF